MQGCEEIDLLTFIDSKNRAIQKGMDNQQNKSYHPVVLNQRRKKTSSKALGHLDEQWELLQETQFRIVKEFSDPYINCTSLSKICIGTSFWMTISFPLPKLVVNQQYPSYYYKQQAHGLTSHLPLQNWNPLVGRQKRLARRNTGFQF